MNLCLLGNSHAACFIAAWRDMPPSERKGANITMFVVSGAEISTLARQDKRLVLPDEKLREQFARSSGGLTEIVPEKYDAFVIVGLRYGFHVLTRMILKYSTVELSRNRPGVTLISSACLDACIDTVLEKTIAMDIRALLRSVTEHPVILIPTPCPIEIALEGVGANLAPLRKSGELGRLYDRYVARSHALGKKYGFSFLDQDPRTMIGGGGYTRNEFGRGGIKYGRDETKAKAGPDDMNHMNADFGRMALNNLLSATRKLPQSR